MGYLPEPSDEVDGFLVCECCGEIIAGGTKMLELPNGHYMCESCVEDNQREAPYREEGRDW